MKKLAIFFPGIGYNKDKPLLYYSAKLAKSLGYEIIHIEYFDLPADGKSDAALMEKAAKIAFTQAEEQLKNVNFEEYDRVLFIGKSIGTIILAAYVCYHKINAGQIWYTPVVPTFQFGSKNVLAFIGDADPWADIADIKEKAKSPEVELSVYEDCNHSLETGVVDRDISTLSDVMRRTEEFMK